MAFGAPHFWLTTTTAPDRSLVMFIDGEEHKGLTMKVNDLLDAKLPTKIERTHQTAHRPFSAAEYFTFVFSIIFKYIIGI